MYNSLKNVFIHENASLNNLLKKTDIIAKLSVADVYIQEYTHQASSTLIVCMSQTHDQISTVNKLIEDINETIVMFNSSFFRLRSKPNIDILLQQLEDEIHILDGRINTMLKVNSP